jgi:peptide/nickel transport system substrate-binding protein
VTVSTGSSPFNRRTFIRGSGKALVIAGGLPALLSACTNAENPGQNPSPNPGGSSTGTLRVGWSSEPDTLNPMTTYSTEAQEVLQLVYDKLLDYDAHLNVVPGLAEKTAVSDDGNTITYALRSGVQWHDGTPFTAADVVFTLSLIKDKNLSQYAQWLIDMTDVTAPDDATVVVKFKQPQAFDPGLAIPILPEHIWKGKSAAAIQKFANSNPVGTGPFTFVSWEKGQTVTVKTNPKFWGTAPGAATVIWVLFQNEDVMAQALKAGQVDVLTEVPPTIWDGLQGASGITPVSVDGFSFHHIGINVSTSPKSGGNPLLQDVAVRQALSLAVDRNQLVQIALAGHGKPGSVLLPPAFGDYFLDIPADQQLNANPTKANETLDGAGYSKKNADGVRLSSSGKPLEFRLIAIESTTVDVRAAQIFAAAAKEVGIKLNLQTMDENTLGEIVYNSDAPNWDIFVWGWDSGVNDPDYLLGVPLSSQIGGNNDVYYADPSYDSLYAQQAAELDKATRVGLVKQMQQKYYEDCPYIVMWYQNKLQAYTDAWKGWVPTPGGIVFNFSRANYLGVRQS